VEERHGPKAPATTGANNGKDAGLKAAATTEAMRFLSVQAERLAGAKREEKTSAAPFEMAVEWRVLRRNHKGESVRQRGQLETTSH